MATFVLVLFLSDGRGSVTIPGYESKDACDTPGREVFNSPVGPAGTRDRPEIYTYTCVRGPKR